MSGGVDSAVAAARAVDAGHDVTGVHLALSRAPQSHRAGARELHSASRAHVIKHAACAASAIEAGKCEHLAGYKLAGLIGIHHLSGQGGRDHRTGRNGPQHETRKHV